VPAWTATLLLISQALQQLLDCFDLPKPSEGNKEHKMQRVLDFLEKPEAVGSKDLAAEADKKKAAAARKKEKQTKKGGAKRRASDGGGSKAKKAKTGKKSKPEEGESESEEESAEEEEHKEEEEEHEEEEEEPKPKSRSRRSSAAAKGKPASAKKGKGKKAAAEAKALLKEERMLHDTKRAHADARHLAKREEHKQTGQMCEHGVWRCRICFPHSTH